MHSLKNSKQDVLLVLVRHGQSEVNTKGIFSSSRDNYPLTEKGREQAGAISEELKKLNVSKIYSSPVKRAVETATIISTNLGLNFEQDDRLAERGFGSLEGTSYSGYSWRMKKEEYGVEEFGILCARMNSFMNDLSNGVVVAVTHGDTMRAPALRMLGLDETSGFGLRAHNANIAVIQIKDGWHALIAFGMPMVSEELLKKIPERFLAVGPSN